MEPGVDIRNPTPAQMTAALLAAARAECWNHWGHEIDRHASDWVKVDEMRKPMTAEQFARLPEAVARYQFVRLCVYSYGTKVVWGYYCPKMAFEGYMLSDILVVYDPVVDEIIHCMRPRKPRHYCERWGDQGKLFVPVRW